MQYRQGICAVTPRPISSFVLPLSAVFGLSASVFTCSQNGAIASSGCMVMNAGTVPSICFASASAAFESCASAAKGTSTAITAHFSPLVRIWFVTSTIGFDLHPHCVRSRPNKLFGRYGQSFPAVGRVDAVRAGADGLVEHRSERFIGLIYPGDG